MGIVRELRSDVYRKIAAGEVVERPASVVKELVENAIDAGASEVRVELLRGGKERIKVTDDGHGFLPEDIEPAFRRHSTSKLKELSDFNHLCSLGFRGEALPSIGEVARVELKTSSRKDGSGTFCRFTAGKMDKRSDTAFRRGTQITVSDLFYNLPVRRKFLKTDRTELNRITDFVEKLALIHHGVGFYLSHDRRDILSFSATDKFSERVYQVLGPALFRELKEIEFSLNRVSLRGFISKLNTGRSVKKHQFFFVNRRPVREATLIAAVNNTFSRYLAKGRYPVAVLALTIPPGDIDVNIHPMKQEIKFWDNSFIYGFIKKAVEGGFRDLPAPVIPEAGSLKPAAVGEPPPSEATDMILSPRTLTETVPPSEYNLLGQYLNSYILVEKDRKLLIIDQHNAHERVNYEKLTSANSGDAGMGIAPLFPIIIELTPGEMRRFTPPIREILKEIGFDIRILSGNSIDVKSYPWFVEEQNIRDIIVSVLHLEVKSPKVRKKVIADIACRNAIKVNHTLDPMEMKALVDDLFRTDNPYFCPHERPIIKELTLDDVEKMLKRK